MKKAHTLLGFFAFIILCSFSLKNNDMGNFTIKGNLSGFEDNTKVLLLHAQSNSILDTAFIKNERFEFSGEIQTEPQNYVLYIPLKDNMKYTYLFMGDEDITIKGGIEDFPDQLDIKGSEHHALKVAYDKQVSKYDQELMVFKNKMLKLQKENSWNDSLQKSYLGEEGILKKIDAKKTEIEKQFIAENINTFFGLQILYYKRASYSDRALKRIFSKFNKNFQNTKNGKAIKAFLDNPEIKIGEKYIDFEALDREGNTTKLSKFFNSGKYVLLDFSTPTCSNSLKAVPMLQNLNKVYGQNIDIVTFYVEGKKDHFDYFSNPEKSPWVFLWTQQGREGFPYIRYRVNSTPTYYLFSPEGKLIEKWSGFQQGYYDATENKIEKLVGVK